MALDDQASVVQEDEDMVPGSTTSPQDPLTYDPTQGRGTDAWENARKQQAILNARLANNASLRRN